MSSPISIVAYVVTALCLFSVICGIWRCFAKICCPRRSLEEESKENNDPQCTITEGDQFQQDVEIEIKRLTYFEQIEIEKYTSDAASRVPQLQSGLYYAKWRAGDDSKTTPDLSVVCDPRTGECQGQGQDDTGIYTIKGRCQGERLAFVVSYEQFATDLAEGTTKFSLVMLVHTGNEFFGTFEELKTTSTPSKTGEFVLCHMRQPRNPEQTAWVAQAIEVPSSSSDGADIRMAIPTAPRIIAETVNPEYHLERGVK